MAVDALGKTIVVDTQYVVVGQCKIIDGDAITLVLGNQNEVKLRVKAGAIAQLADVIGGGGGAWKDSVRVATTAAGTLSTSFENGDTIDGVTLATGDRILIKNQATASENGIYTVNASGAPTRATDANTGAALVAATVAVQQGTVNADRVFVCFTNPPITLGSTSLSWSLLQNLLGPIEGSQLIDGSVDVVKLFGAELSTGAILYCDGSSWVVLEPPSASSHLTHPGGSAAPAWTAL